MSSCSVNVEVDQPMRMMEAEEVLCSEAFAALAAPPGFLTGSFGRTIIIVSRIEEHSALDLTTSWNVQHSCLHADCGADERHKRLLR
jgi:hypothetical protein